MPNYRRTLIPGGSYFFTVNLLDRKDDLLVREVAHLRQSFSRAKRRHPFRMDAIVILPDHLHAVITLPDGDSDFPKRWRLIKTYFSRLIPNSEARSDVRRRRNERGIWQRRYWEHFLRDERDFIRHVEYCYFNPVKHKLVEYPRDWKHSTFHRDVRCGRMTPDWSGREVDGEFGE
ncbi:MAG: transposase [Alphaproteobacteria bacterium]|nr:transposase [Alphaproteobacteria bacterium]